MEPPTSLERAVKIVEQGKPPRAPGTWPQIGIEIALAGDEAGVPIDTVTISLLEVRAHIVRELSKAGFDPIWMEDEGSFTMSRGSVPLEMMHSVIKGIVPKLIYPPTR